MGEETPEPAFDGLVVNNVPAESMPDWPERGPWSDRAVDLHPVTNRSTLNVGALVRRSAGHFRVCRGRCRSGRALGRSARPGPDASLPHRSPTQQGDQTKRTSREIGSARMGGMRSVPALLAPLAGPVPDPVFTSFEEWWPPMSCRNLPPRPLPVRPGCEFAARRYVSHDFFYATYVLQHRRPGM